MNGLSCLSLSLACVNKIAYNLYENFALASSSIEIFNFFHLQKLCVFFINISRHGNQYLGFSCTSATFSFFRDSSEVSFIHLYQAIKSIICILLSHSLSNFLQHSPSNPITDTQFFRQRKGGMSSFIATHKKYCPKPNHKRCTSSVHYRPSGKRCLISTRFAPIMETAPYQTIFIILAPWTNETFWPPKTKNILCAVLLGRKGLMKLK
jgi:hypothetical protein